MQYPTKLYMDCETTGTDKNVHSMWQWAGLIEKNGQVVDELEVKCHPFNMDNIEEGALTTCGVTREELAQLPPPSHMHSKIVRFFDKHVSKFDKKDKMRIIGYNVGFDVDFMYSFFKKMGDNYLGSYIKAGTGEYFDVLHYIGMLWRMGYLPTPDKKLGTMCKYFNIPIKAHDALSDIHGTRQLALKLNQLFKIIKPEEVFPDVGALYK